MAIEADILRLVSDFRSTLDQNVEQLKCFCKKGVQVEGWLKGEMLFFLDNETGRKVITEFEREVWMRPNSSHRNRYIVDLKIISGSKELPEEALIELKHWMIGYQKKTFWYAHTYFSDPSSVGLSLYAKKLLQISNKPSYILILATANPGSDDWYIGI